MNKYIKSLAVTALAGAAALGAQAQDSYSGYFLDNYLYRHTMNPAMGNARNYVGFPGLSNLGVGIGGSLHLKDLLYNVNGKTVLFTNPNVAAAEVMKNISDRERLGVNVRENIINFGFRGMGGYNTVGINAVANANVGLPGSIFSLLKEGISNRTYDLSNLDLRAQGYVEIALNHSHDIDALPGLRVGGTLKFLVGFADVEGKFDRADLSLNQDKWDITSNAYIHSSMHDFRYKTRISDGTGKPFVNGIETPTEWGPGGYGAAVDLGAVYEWRDFTFSAAVVDLGGISWGSDFFATTQGEKRFSTNDYTFDIDDDSEKSTFDQMTDALSALYELDDMGDQGSRTSMLATTLNFGVQYTAPFYRRLSFGLLNTTRIYGPFTTTDFRLSANCRPTNSFSVSANVVAGTYGLGFGWMLNLNCPGFGLFLGMDRTPGHLAKQGVPLNSNLNLNLGLDFPF